jgi:hypothetical protein
MLESGSNLAQLKKTNPLSKRLETVFHTSLDEPETLDALKALSDLSLVDQKTNFKDLRKIIDLKLQNINQNLVQSFEQVDNEMTKIGLCLKTLKQNCNQMESTLLKAIEDTNPVIKKTTHLKSKNHENETKNSISKAFLENYSLNSNEITNLTLDINLPFFDAFEHLEKIIQDCKVLLQYKQTAGLEIMDKLNILQEQAFDKLFKWTRLESRLLKQESPEVSTEFRLAMQAFRKRPILFE